jgi:succinate-semialdehyde dehydrogenase/glutarate-semialdehyde dehydrogenase
VFVERAVADLFAELVVDRVEALRQGGPDEDRGTDVGPATQREHLDHLEQQIADAVRRGARIAAGGERRRDLGAQFFSPTVLTGCTPEMAVMREETFGPVLPIMTVESVEHAVQMANDPPGGLAGSVWSRDIDRARAVARRLRTGSVCLNDALVNYLCVEAPLGGVSPSGLGFRHGPEALRQFCQVRTILEDAPILGRASALVGRTIAFPYRRRVLRALRWLMRTVY